MRADAERDPDGESSSPPLSRLLRAGTGAVAVALVVASLVSVVTIVSSQRTANDLASNIGPLRTDNAALLRVLVDAETGLRGYQVTGETVTLEPYESAMGEFDDLLASMRRRAGDRADWQRLIDDQEELAGQWFDEYAPEVINRVAAGDPSATSDATVERGKAIVDQFRDVNARLQVDLLEARVDRLDRSRTFAVVAVVAIAVILLAALAILYWRSRRIRRLVADPLHDLRGTIAAFQRGDLSARTDVRGSREVEAVARALDDVATWAEQLILADRRRLRQAQLIRELTSHMRQELGVRDVLDRTVRELGPALDADRALVIALGGDGQLGEILAEWANDGVATLGVGARMPTDSQRDAAIRTGLRLGQTLEVADVAEAPELLPATRQLLRMLNAGSLLMAPVVAGDEPIAAFVLLTDGRTREWPPEAMPVAVALAADMATALTHARLYEQEAEMVARLRDLDQAKSDFVSSVSHELRTPLTSIRGYVEMLRDGDAGELDDEQQHMLSVVERNTDRLLALIEDLLTLSRIESGAFRVALAPVELGPIVEGLLAEMEPHARARGVQLCAEIDAILPPVLGDMSQLERVLLNLLSNAIKFTPDGGSVVVRVSSENDEIELAVIDEGIGIPPEEQGRLFTRFFRASSAQDRAIQGTGLGLVIVKSIVDHHGGRIDVRSQPGEGSTFAVRLPIARVAAEVS